MSGSLWLVASTVAVSVRQPARFAVVPADRRRDDAFIRRRFGGRPSAAGDAAPARPRAAPPDARRTATSCSSTTCCGCKRARQEHDAFADTLARPRRRGALPRRSPRRDARRTTSAASWLLDARRHRARPRPDLAAPWHVGRGRSTPRRRWPGVSSAASLTAELPAGVAGPRGRDAATRRLRARRRCPNHLFTRDTSCWIYGGVSLNPMAKPARRRETVHLEAIYRFHPTFTARAVRPLVRRRRRRLRRRATIEGGDVLVIGNGAVLIGMGERTTPQAVEALAAALFAAGARDEVVAVELPQASGRSCTSTRS